MRSGGQCVDSSVGNRVLTQDHPMPSELCIGLPKSFNKCLVHLKKMFSTTSQGGDGADIKINVGSTIRHAEGESVACAQNKQTK